MNETLLYKTPEGEKAVMALYDAAMKNWPVPYNTQVLSTPYGETFVIACGDTTSPAMILLHGAGGNSTMWAGDVVDYSQRYRVYAVDLPGEAGKSADNRPAWDSPAFGEWLEDVLDGLHLDHVTLVGISQGAWAALKLAVARPERVDQLVLMTPGGIVPDRASFLIRAIGYMMLGNWGIRRMVRALFGDQAVSEDVIQIVVQMTAHFKPRIGVLPIFTDAELRQLTMPTLLLGGTKDIMRDIDKIEARLREFVPQLQVRKIAGAGHAMADTVDDVMVFLRANAVENTTPELEVTQAFGNGVGFG